MRKLILLLSILMCSLIQAQKINVTGTITDALTGEPIPGAIVLILNSSKGAQADFDGKYTIESSKGEVLEFSSLGYTTKKITVDKSVINVVLEEDSEQLGEVVVVGYGAKRKELVTGAYSSIKSEEIQKNNPVQIDQALQGKVSGVQISSNSGSPGSSFNIRIRGVTTNGDNSPLVVVDGIPIGTDLSIIDPNDIETMDVIKDSSSAIYGVQGANGVILITTKKGSYNSETKFTYNAFVGLQETSNTLDLLKPLEYAALVNEMEANDGNAIPYQLQNIGQGTDWQDELFQTALIKNHNLSAIGGGENYKFNISGSLLDQDGIIAPDKSNFQRFTVKNNLSVNLTDKLKAETFLLYTNIKRQTITENSRGSILYYAMNASPLTSVYDGTDGSGPSGGYSYIGTEQGNEIVNPLAVIDNTYNNTKTNRFTGKFQLEYELLDDLKLTSRYNFNYANVNHRQYTPLQYYGLNKVVNSIQLDGANFDYDRNDDGDRDVYSTVYEYTENYYDYTWESFMNYDFEINESHSLQSMLGFSVRSAQYKGVYASGYLTGNDSWDNAFLSNTQSFIQDDDDSVDGENDIFETSNPSSGISEDRWFSVFGRLQYDYEQKYLLSAMVRRDASTRFGANNRVGYFPSVSAGWIVSKENFFNEGWISNLKLRGSWGITGNDKIGSYSWIGLLQGVNGESSYPFDDTLSLGNSVGALSNPDLQWETNYQTNFGVDASFFNGKLGLNLDYYIKRTEDLLLQPDVSALLGSAAGGSEAPFVNAGTVENKGFDLGLTFNHDFSEDLSISLNYNLTSIDNKVLEVNNATGFISGGLFGLSQDTSRMQTGLPIGAFYGLQTDGVFQTQAEIDALATTIDGETVEYQAGAAPGDLKYVDVNGDGIVEFGSENDLTVLGNPIPDFTMGGGFNVYYKSFDFGATFNASIGNEIVRGYERFITYSNKLSLYNGRWTGAGTSNEIPIASTNASNNQLFSSFYIEDGSYLRIQNVQIGYTLEGDSVKASGLDKLRIYVSANNLYTFTKYRGYDPDITNQNAIGAGVDLGQYPQARTFIAGIKVSF